MKIGVVHYSTLVKFGRWDALFYLDPTRDVDKAIARAKQTIARVQARLRKLRAERKRIVEQHREVRRELKRKGGK